MSASQETLERLYRAFDAGDGIAMSACYADDARFSDPVYPDLEGVEVGAMWRMLTGRATDLSVEVEQIHTKGPTGTSTWIARYSFGPDRRPVVNRVHSAFTFSEGLIATERDSFDFHAWSAQALGLKGRLLGWTPMVRSAVRAEAVAQLREFRAAEGARPPTP